MMGPMALSMRRAEREAASVAGTLEKRDGAIDVLVVDDEADVASTTAEILERAGMTTVTAASLVEAQQLIRANEVRSVILDHQVADADAQEFLQAQRDLPPVIVISGVGRDILEEFETTHGNRLFACRAKPVPPPELIDLVRTALASAQTP
jgi:DNA-binding NtrC family response regulator